MHRLANLADVLLRVIDREAHIGLAVALEAFEDRGVKRGSARAGVDLGGDRRQPEFGQRDQFAPADRGEFFTLVRHGRTASPSPPSPAVSRRSTRPLA